MTSKTIFKPQEEPVLFKIYSSIEEQIPQDKRVRLISSMVDALDIADIVKSYKGGGASAYHPRAILKALFFGYMDNHYSCRDIAECIKWDGRYRWLCGGYEPSYRTVNRFRTKRLGQRVHELFGQILLRLVQEGWIDIATIFIDGTTMEARSSRYSIVWRKTIRRYAEDNTEKIRGLISQIEELAKLEDTMSFSEDGMISNEDIARLHEALKEKNEQASLKAQTSSNTVDTTAAKEETAAEEEATDDTTQVTKQVVKENAQETTKQDTTSDIKKNPQEETSQDIKANAQEKEGTSQNTKRTKRLSKEEKELSYRLLKAAEYNNILETIGPDRNSTCKTDPAATGQHPKDDVLHKGPNLAMYNMQIGTTSQFVVGYGLYSLTSDTNTLPSFISNLTSLLSPNDPTKHGIQRVVADSGYGCLSNYNALSQAGIAGYLKYPGYDNPNPNPFSIDNLPYDPQADEYTCPANKKLKRVQSSNPNIARYESNDCSDCPLKEKCFKQTAERPNRVSEVNTRWRELKPLVRELLDTPTGQELLRERTIEPESVFGQTKNDHRYRRFRYFNKEMNLVDIAIYFIAHNLSKLAKALSDDTNSPYFPYIIVHIALIHPLGVFQVPEITRKAA